MSEKLVDGYYKIRPAARLIHTIGSDLIGDSYAALVELVKNSYDADANKVDIIFNFKKDSKGDLLTISIKDDGHGMSFDTVINKWLVPATDDKLNRKKSPKKLRSFQGRKGIGRFAAAFLGQEMTMQTVDVLGEKTTIVIDWRVFNTDDFLENVNLLVEREKTDKNSGCLIEIFARDETSDAKISLWNKETIDNLIKELRKLISPFKEFSDFKINIQFINSSHYNDETFEIGANPIIGLYDYRIFGTILPNGNAELVYENNVDKALQTEVIKTNYPLEKNGKYCGTVNIDLRVYDREPEAIENLINKGLIDPITKKYFGKQEAKQELNKLHGVNIYRNYFRVWPYGTNGNDWLNLDKDRIQFSHKVSNNQVIGFITIEEEEKSHLTEKSARDGLKENEYFIGLRELIQKSLKELELRRFVYRKKSLKSRGKRNSIYDNVNNLFSFDNLTKSIENELEKLSLSKDSIKEITKILKKEEESKAELLEDIQKTIAIYQGQATLGKIVTFILHEGRKPLQFFKSETNVIERYIKFYQATKDEELLTDLNKSISGFRRNSDLISNLFERISPLATQRRNSKINFNIKETILNAQEIFREKMNDSQIKFTLNCDEKLELYGWKEDLFTSFANLIENSVYWLNLNTIIDKQITIDVHYSENVLIIDYKDNGPGLTSTEIESDVIFEPGYSKKTNGTGLGLAIAGEAIERLDGKLMAKKFTEGAYFQIEIKTSYE